MKVMIDIPKDFEEHFNQDKFKDSIGRITADVISQVYSDDSISGNYEIELLEMLSETFGKAESFHSTCILKGTPIYNDALVKQGKWLINCDGYYPYCSNCMSEPPGRVMTDFCPVCGVKMRGKEND